MANPQGINQYTKRGSPSQRKELAKAVREHRNLKAAFKQMGKRAGHGASIGGMYTGSAMTSAHVKVLNLRDKFKIPAKKRK